MNPNCYMAPRWLAIAGADRVSARRADANRYFFSLNTGVAAAAGLAKPFFDSVHPNHPLDKFGLVFICGLGFVLSSTWWVMLKSYRDLNRAKFAVIQELERDLPAKPFTDEWSSLKTDPVRSWRKRYAELGAVERVVPILFAIANLVVAARVLAF